MLLWLRHRAWPITREIFTRWNKNDAATLAASTAYYAALSFFPLLLVLISGLGVFLQFYASEHDAQEQLRQVLSANTTPAQALFALNDPARGITVNVGTIDGGLRPNVVAPEASAIVDVRAPTAAAARTLERAVKGLKPTLDGAAVEVEGGFRRPPMEPLPRNRALLATAKRIGYELGMSLEDAGLVGGGSDANTTSLFTGTLDGLGPIGEGSHARDERIDIARLPERTALLAMLLLEPVARPRLAGRERRTSSRGPESEAARRKAVAEVMRGL